MISPKPHIDLDITSDPDIALVSSQGLGDGLLLLVFAQNLVRLGYRVTIYQNHLHNLSSILNLVDVKPYLAPKRMETELAKYKVVLFDQGSRFTKDILPEFDRLPRHFIAYTVSRSKGMHKVSLAEFNEHLKLLDSQSFDKFSGFNSTIRHPLKHKLTIGEHFRWKTQKVLGRDDYDLYPSFTVPNDWSAQENYHRILIHPSSSLDHKNWSAHLFLELAERLQQDGWEPEFTVAPNEWERWNSWLNGRFMAPSFASTLDLARYYYESVALVGNDSGNGHLASAMGLPVLTIFNRKKLFYPWKPSWSPNKVVAPWLSKSLVGDKWSNYLSVNTVFSAFTDLIEESGR